jgi:formamidopyrimidine-DNA glycosylase
MPELPDITVYIERLRPRIQGQVLEQAVVVSPFLLRTFDPPLTELEGQTVRELLRLGKRIVWCFDGERFVVLHLMIAGRLHWKPPGARPPGKIGLAALRFPTGTLTLTEAGSKKRASLHVVRGHAALEQHNPGGLEVLACDRDAFAAALTRENHTLKRAPLLPHPPRTSFPAVPLGTPSPRRRRVRT